MIQITVRQSTFDTLGLSAVLYFDPLVSRARTMGPSQCY
jgi:hypothetical protein